MKQITTLIICLLLLQPVFSAPKEPCEEFQSTVSPMELIDPPGDTPEWSMEYRLLLLSETQNQNNAVKVYPNPVYRKDELNISLSGEGTKNLSFYDITGKMVKKVVTERNSVSINIGDLGVGVYILNVKSATLQTTKKVIIR
ncbi:T9SS type A sorting domain-containing protein [Robertkochia marina]|uniref:T9SS type A sorting domain-containing protein n=1 Tax=Robertkochia marina TaxID=1227945 RepID=A0A4S3LXW5_9FLAO|nr:T9SS type A sorting domain-containing protein [Robertkochia marina]THD65761.1 T9SS type A sorting domain-containing protein [Robertkochia marina]TRZ46554.1 T9SS C-terminal target domain-containing protein [Robertkochia marina]